MTPFLTITQSSATYPVYVGRDLLPRVGELIAPRGKVFVITSRALHERFGAVVRDAQLLLIEEGEAHKTVETANDVVTQLLDHGAKRDSMAVVVGGGMIGDTAGFAASVFLRGIDLVHVPTTLLAQVDSSIGGKLAVNHPKGKNLIGSFFPPRAVISDTSVLDTLPPRERLSGMYEALKGGVIADPALFAMFEQPAFDVDEMVRKAIRVKAEIVSADEKEADLRRLLNYGHTIAHGIEASLQCEGIARRGGGVGDDRRERDRGAARIALGERSRADRARDSLVRTGAAAAVRSRGNPRRHRTRQEKHGHAAGDGVPAARR
jgi:3-dehydroquinate synthase